MQINKYVIGFVFDTKTQEVLLIEKKRPNWQKGLLNGVGGKAESFETDRPVLAMVREAEEETGLQTRPEDWLLFHNELHVSGNDLFFYVADIKDFVHQVRMRTDEMPVFVPYDLAYNGFFDKVRVQPDRMLYNLNWLIPMALCYLKYPEHRYTRG